MRRELTAQLANNCDFNKKSWKRDFSVSRAGEEKGAGCAHSCVPIGRLFCSHCSSSWLTALHCKTFRKATLSFASWGHEREREGSEGPRRRKKTKVSGVETFACPFVCQLTWGIIRFAFFFSLFFHSFCDVSDGKLTPSLRRGTLEECVGRVTCPWQTGRRKKRRAKASGQRRKKKRRNWM